MTQRILIAEDDRHTRAALGELLQDEGFEVITVGDGMSAMRSIETNAFDLICLDVMMPMKSGFDVCRNLRKTNPRTPVIFITAKGEEIDKVVGFELGADDYISKPFGSHEVIARVKAVLRRCSSNTGADDADVIDPSTVNDFQMAGLRVQPSKMRACRDDQPAIELTMRELQILVALFRARGDVVSRRTLYRLCWDNDRIPNSRTVDQTVSQLRKRIERDAKHPLIIETVYGVGYRHDPSPES